MKMKNFGGTIQQSFMDMVIALVLEFNLLQNDGQVVKSVKIVKNLCNFIFSLLNLDHQRSDIYQKIYKAPPSLLFPNWRWGC